MAIPPLNMKDWSQVGESCFLMVRVIAVCLQQLTTQYAFIVPSTSGLFSSRPTRYWVYIWGWILSAPDLQHIGFTSESGSFQLPTCNILGLKWLKMDHCKIKVFVIVSKCPMIWHDYTVVCSTLIDVSAHFVCVNLRELQYHNRGH